MDFSQLAGSLSARVPQSFTHGYPPPRDSRDNAFPSKRHRGGGRGMRRGRGRPMQRFAGNAAQPVPLDQQHGHHVLSSMGGIHTTVQVPQVGAPWKSEPVPDELKDHPLNSDLMTLSLIKTMKVIVDAEQEAQMAAEETETLMDSSDTSAPQELLDLSKRTADAGLKAIKTGLEAIQTAKCAAIAASASPPHVVVIDLVEACAATVDTLSSSTLLSVSLEGYKLGRFGEISMIMVFDGEKTTYLFDISKMGQAAFEAGKLRELLTNTYINKLLYDVRLGSDALWGRYNVELRGVLDLQVLAVADVLKREGKLPKHIPSFANIVPMTTLERSRAFAVKKVVREKFLKKCVSADWEIRPIPSLFVEYCANDVTYYPKIMEKLGGKTLMKNWCELSDARAKLYRDAPKAAKQGNEVDFADWMTDIFE